MLGFQKCATQFCYFNKLLDAFQLQPMPPFCKSAKQMKKFLASTNSLFYDICRTSRLPAHRLREFIFQPTIEYLDPNDPRCIREIQEARLPKVPLIEPPCGPDGIDFQCFSNPMNDRVIQFVQERLLKPRSTKKPKYKRTTKRMQKFYAQVAGKPLTPEQIAEKKKKKTDKCLKKVDKRKKYVEIDGKRYTRIGTFIDYGDQKPWDEIDFKSHSINYQYHVGQVNT